MHVYIYIYIHVYVYHVCMSIYLSLSLYIYIYIYVYIYYIYIYITNPPTELQCNYSKAAEVIDLHLLIHQSIPKHMHTLRCTVMMHGM